MNLADLKLKQFSKPAENGCVLFTGHLDKDGYGRVRVGRRMYRTHRLAWELANSSIEKGICICHKCDNPSCVNPDHLFAGTPKDNTQDMFRKGRQSRRGGVDNGNSKLTPDKVLRLREMHAAGASLRELSNTFSIHPAYASQVANGFNWKEIV